MSTDIAESGLWEAVPPSHATAEATEGGMMEVQVQMSPVARLVQVVRSLTPKRGGMASQFHFDGENV